VTIDAADVVAPVFTATEVVVLFPAGVAGETSLRSILRVLGLKREDDFFRIAFFRVRLAWSMTRFAPGNAYLPTSESRQPRVRSVFEVFELFLVAGLADVAADVIVTLVLRRLGLGLRLY